MLKFVFLLGFVLLPLVRADVTGIVLPEENEPSFDSSEDVFDALQSNSMKEFKLNNDSQVTGPTNVTLSITNRTLLCNIDNLIPNNGYVVNFYRNEVAFAFYRVRGELEFYEIFKLKLNSLFYSVSDVIWSTMNLNAIFDLFPVRGSQSAYPNFTVNISNDSKLYGNYQCSVKLLGIQKDDDEIVFNSNRVLIVKEEPLTAFERWNKVFPRVNTNFTLFEEVKGNEKIYEAKCKIRFDRPVSGYIVYFLAEDKPIGAYIVSTDPNSNFFTLFFLQNFLIFLILYRNQMAIIHKEFV